MYVHRSDWPAPSNYMSSSRMDELTVACNMDLFCQLESDYADGCIE